jgi:hypothetical protein
MKGKLIFPIFISLFSIVFGKGQLTNNSKIPVTDSQEIRAFAQLVSYIFTDTQGLKLAEAENNYVNRLGEQHFLYVPIVNGIFAVSTANSSWDLSLPSVYNKEPTQGSPFLVFSYVPGLVITNSYTVLNAPNFRYNYDKMSGNLLVKKNNDSAIAVNKESVKSFCLKFDKGGIIFMRVAIINDNEFFQVLCKGPKYSSYKLYKSKFINANQKTNGYVTEGMDYDEYMDIVTYYLVDEKNEISHIFELRRKSIKSVFGSANSVVEKYFKDHKYEDITESSIANLTAELNK